jgi:hypothetical protein
MHRAWILVAVLACHRGSPTPVPPAPPASQPIAAQPTDAAPATESSCGRYAELMAAVESCTALSEEARQDLVQWQTDTLAAISESGMDDSTPVDEEALCDEAAQHVLAVAKQTCGL